MQDDPAADGPPGLPPDDDARVGAVWSPVAEGSPMGEDGPPDPRICPFLQAIDEHDALGMPVEAPDPANRCAALATPVPQSLRQQELVCLTSGHVNCPRYLRGSQIAINQPPQEPASRVLTPATAVALLVFAAAFMLSLAFVVTNGGLQIAVAAPGPDATRDLPGAVPSAVPSSGPVAAATLAPSAPPASSPVAVASPVPTALVTPSPIPTAIPTTAATPAPTRTPTAAPTPRPSSGRYALLKPCPDKPNCWIYVIRHGDNLYSIANYFGVPQATIQSLNPWTKTSGLKAGRQLRLPPPTR